MSEDKEFIQGGEEFCCDECGIAKPMSRVEVFSDGILTCKTCYKEMIEE